MIKIAALNKELEEECRSDEDVTREALEQISLQQYSKALELHRAGNVQDAARLLKDLLDTELLANVKKPGPDEKIVGPMCNLKYLCYKNLALMLSAAGDVDGAIEAYMAASELDDTDITLWHRLGSLFMRASHFEKALYSFRRGVERNPKHWPCLDKIVTLLLGLDDKRECLYTIQDILTWEPTYMRGIVYRKHIYSKNPYIKDFMEFLHPINKSDEDDESIFKEYPPEMVKILLEEAEDIHAKVLEQQKAREFKPMIPNLKLNKPITQFTWESVGDSLVDMHNYMSDNYFSHACPIEIVFDLQENPKKVCEDMIVEPVETNNEELQSMLPVSECNNVADKEKVVEAEKPPVTMESDVEMVAAEPQVDNSNGTKKKAPVRRRGSALSFLQQWEWCSKRRSGRKKPDNKNDHLDDNIYEKLRRMVPKYLSPESIKKEEEESRKKEEENIQHLDENVQEADGTKQNSEVIQWASEKIDLPLGQKQENPGKDTQDTEKVSQTLREDSNQTELDASNTENGQQNLEELKKKVEEDSQIVEDEISPKELKKKLEEESMLILRYRVRKTPKEKRNLEYYAKTFKRRKTRKRFKSRSENLDVILEEHEKESEDSLAEETEEYFGSESEMREVKQFIEKYTADKKDIIDMLNDYLYILAKKWYIKWSEQLSKIYVAANKCYRQHISMPACTEDNHQELLHFAAVNLLAEEFSVNEELNSATHEHKNHELSDTEYVKLILMTKSHIFPGPDVLEYILRVLWVNIHIHVLNKSDEFALDCLYQLTQEFDAMGEDKDNYCLEMVNFTFKPCISLVEVCNYIKFLERNKKLATVMDLHKGGNYEEVLSILIDSFEHCKEVGKKHEDEMSLDFALQLVLILESAWALKKTETCFKWALTCLHEALAHYFRFTSGSPEYDKWTLAVIKIVSCMEYILTNEGLLCLEEVSRKELSQGVEDLIRVIGHQVETNAVDMPFKTVSPWIIIHYILQREDDHGRGIVAKDEEIPSPLMVLFIAHEQLGNRGWCCENDGKLLYFTLDTVVPRLRSPSLSKCLEQICQHMEQCVYCLFGHPARKSKLKYLSDHNVSPHALSWPRAQQLYEIFRPPALPALEGKVSGISADTEQLFHRILALLPEESNPNKYYSDMEKYIKGVHEELPSIPNLIPYKMKDIYFLLGDYYFKKEEGKMAVKFNILDVIVNNDRLESWAEISLAKAVNLERLLNSCKNINNERDFLNPAKSIIRCFQRSLELDPTHCNMWIEYGMFVYTVHSFCSRLLKQASESLSMESFEALEKQKEDMLDTTHKCFINVLNDSERRNKNREFFSDDDNEEAWLHFYMLGKVAEKRNRPPSEYLKYYMQGVKSLQETYATYPLKINYYSPTHLCIEVLELHYRIHASILKYMEQHENKPVPASVGKVFLSCIEDWKNGPFNKRNKKDSTIETDPKNKQTDGTVQPGNILKRSASDTGEEESPASKKMKEETAAVKVQRSASYSEPTKSSSSSSSSGSSSSSSSDSSSDSDSDAADPAAPAANKPLSEDDTNKIVNDCLEALEDCASRFSPHYKAIYRLAHYHFYSKKGKNIERCRDLMISNFTSRTGQKLAGLFSERKQTNFFNNVWKIPLSEVDRAGGFAFHMSRCVLLTMDILKEIDDHKTLLDLSLHLQRIPEPDKTYLRDSDREELAQQAFSLCVQSLKGQLLKFSQQEDLKSNDVERQALNSLMLDIYRAYQRVQKQPNSKQFTNLLIDGYKLVSPPIAENSNLVDLSMKYCQSLIQTLKQQATQASLDKSQNAQKKQSAKAVETAKISAPIASQPEPDPKPSTSAKATVPPQSTANPMMMAQEMAASLQSYLPVLKDQMLSSQAAAAISYLSNISALAGFSPLQNTLQNSFQAEFFRQFTQSLVSPFNLAPPKPKQKRGPKPGSTRSPNSNARMSKAAATAGRAQTTITSIQKPQHSSNVAGLSKGSTAYSKSSSVPKPSVTVAPVRKTASAYSKSSTNVSGGSKTTTASLPSSVKTSTASSKAVSVLKSLQGLSIKPAYSKSSTNVSSLAKTSSASLAPSMGTVLSSLPPSMSVNLSSFGGSSLPQSSGVPAQAHTSSASTSTAFTKPFLPPQSVSSGKTLQEKLAERQKIKRPVGQASGTSLGSRSAAPSKPTSDSSQPQSHASGESAQHNDAPKTKQVTEEIIVLDDD